MKKIVLLIVVGFLSFNIYSQSSTIIKDPVNQEANFFQIQKNFNDTWKGKKIVKGRGYKQFKRWEWYWEQRVGKSGKFPKSSVIYDEWKKYNFDIKKYRKTESTSENWTFMGPDTSSGGYAGIGRINCIAFHPTLINTFWVGTPAGGLWKTIDGGITWTTNTDALPVLGVSDIAIDPTNANIMYIATGDGEAPSNYGDTKSLGVLKSIDGGITWNVTGLNWDASDYKLIRRLLIDPSNSQILIAATSDGIYRTINGGVNWNKQQSGWFIDAEFKPSDPNTVYAATYDYFGAAQIFRSIDNGVSWTQVTAFSDVTRINLAVSANASSIVDAVCVDMQNGLQGLYHSANSGTAFTQYYAGNCTNNLLDYSPDASACGGQGFYDLAYAINPANSNEIWLGAINTWKSADGGTNWVLNNYWNDAQSPIPVVHADKHFIAFHPLNNSIVFECNDGGLYKTTDGGSTWQDITNGMGISQIYRIGTSAKITDDVICGLQDNGTKEYFNSTWHDQAGGDGMECIIDYDDGDIKYCTYVYGQISKTTDGGTNWNVIVENDGTGVDEEGEWVTPYIMHPTDHNTLLVGKSQVYKTTDGGTSWNQLGNIFGMTGKIISMAYAPSDPNTIYVASQFEIFQTTDGGVSWNLMKTSTNSITYIVVDPFNAQRVWTTNSGYTVGDKVWYSNDGGSNWTNVSGTLPNLPVNCIVYEKGSNDKLYIGTDVGVFYKDSTMTDWVAFNTGLPNVVVNELEISYLDNQLWAATYGRGLWKSDLKECNLTIAVSGSVTICKGSNVMLGISGGVNYLWSNGSTSSSILVNPTATTSYSVTAFQSTCTKSSVVKVTVNQLPTITVSSNVTICIENSTLLSVAGATVYSWSPSKSLSATNIAVVTANPTTSITYTVTGITNNCYSTNTIKVSVHPSALPTITIMGENLSSSSVNGNQWYLGGVAISGATSQIYIPKQNGVYSVKITDSNGCLQTSNDINIATVGIKEIINLESVQIFPNPSNGSFALFVNSSQQQRLNISVFNVLGEKVVGLTNLECPIGKHNQSIELKHIVNGTYFLSIEINQEIKVFKILKFDE